VSRPEEAQDEGIGTRRDPAMTLNLLAAADLHLGRRPSRLPGSLTDRISARDLGPSSAWARLVDLALEEGAHGVLLAGDVVEGESDFFEAFAELRSGVRRLLDGHIRVLAVAGNHDTKVLPYLADELEGFELLGRGGSWEAVTLAGGGEEATVWGWSFPHPGVRDDPVTGQTFERGPGINLGILHCDRDQVGTPYAPVPSRALEAAAVDGWLLGHIHRPDPLSIPRPMGYLGSLTGLSPGEPGPRGAWLMRVGGGVISSLEHRTIAPLRWVPLDVDLTEINEPEAARGRFLDRIRDLDASVLEEANPPRAVGLRVTFTGRTRFRTELAGLFPQEDLGDIEVGEGNVHYFVETLHFDTLPEVELETLARQNDPAGLLARRLLLLDRAADDPERRVLLSGARQRLERVACNSVWQGLNTGPPDPEDTAERLRMAGRQALDLLLSRRQEG